MFQTNLINTINKFWRTKIEEKWIRKNRTKIIESSTDNCLVMSLKMWNAQSCWKTIDTKHKYQAAATTATTTDHFRIFTHSMIVFDCEQQSREKWNIFVLKFFSSFFHVPYYYIYLCDVTFYFLLYLFIDSCCFFIAFCSLHKRLHLNTLLLSSSIQWWKIVNVSEYA